MFIVTGTSHKYEIVASIINEQHKPVELSVIANYTVSRLVKNTSTSIIYITGPSGSGKTTLAAMIRRQADNAVVLHIDRYVLTREPVWLTDMDHFESDLYWVLTKRQPRLLIVEGNTSHPEYVRNMLTLFPNSLVLCPIPKYDLWLRIQEAKKRDAKYFDYSYRRIIKWDRTLNMSFNEYLGFVTEKIIKKYITLNHPIYCFVHTWDRILPPRIEEGWYLRYKGTGTDIE